MSLPTTPDFAAAEALTGQIVGWTRFARGFYADRVLSRDATAAEALIRAAVIRHGGTLIEPPAATGSSWGPVDFELALLGCTGTGPTIEACARDWAKAARRMGSAT